MFGRLFQDHPKSLGLSWAEHGSGALAIGARMVASGLACIVHAAVPGLFTETAGRTVASLHGQMMKRKSSATDPASWPDYEI